MRFNQQTKEAEIKPETKPKSSKSFLSFLSLLLKTILVIVVVYGGVIGSKFLIKKFSTQERQDYAAVFLANGQVYFGKIYKIESQEIIMNDVFYLQVNDGTNGLNQSHFNLVKLGTEIHGPTDELFINKSQVVFYEYLRPDSKLVESIKNYKI